MSKKRKVEFDSLNEVIDEAEALLVSGYDRSGEWSLGEICDHLARSLKAQTGLTSNFPTVFQAAGAVMADAFARAAGGLSMPTAIPPERGISDETGVKRLRKAVKRFKKRSKNAAFPPFSNRTPKLVRQFHLRHCEHHFGFLSPDKPTRVKSIRFVQAS